MKQKLYVLRAFGVTRRCLLSSQSRDVFFFTNFRNRSALDYGTKDLKYWANDKKDQAPTTRKVKISSTVSHPKL